MRIVFIAILLLSLCSCANIGTGSDKNARVAQQFFQHYAKREDFVTFMSFYAEHAQLIDVVYGHHAQSKTEIRQFLDWQRGEFVLLKGDNILTVSKQTSQANTVITQGYFHRFSYNGEIMGPWLFSIILEFDNNHKIIKQTDWINYTPRENFLGGKDVNSLIPVN